MQTIDEMFPTNEDTLFNCIVREIKKKIIINKSIDVCSVSIKNS